MQQIELYYTEKLKYLKLGDYIRYFEQEDIDTMLACIKNQETPVKIRTTKEILIRHKLSKNSKVIYTYEELSDKDLKIVLLTPDIAKSDIQSLYNGTLNYVVYKPKNKDLLGDKCYLVANRQWQKWFIKKGDMALTLDNIKDLDFKKVVKIVFEGKEVKC